MGRILRRLKQLRFPSFDRSDHAGEWERSVENPDGLRHVHGSFDRLADHRDVFQRLKPEVVLDMVPSIHKGGHGIAFSAASRTEQS